MSHPKAATERAAARHTSATFRRSGPEARWRSTRRLIALTAASCMVVAGVFGISIGKAAGAAPAVSSFAPTTGTTTSEHSISYSLAFDKAVAGLSVADFTVGGTSTGWSVTGVTHVQDGFNTPHAVTTDGTYLYVADTQNDRIVKRLTSDLSFVSSVGARSGR